MIKRLIGTATIVMVASLAFAQGNPRGKVETSMDGKAMTIDYGRPALKGRNLTEMMSQLPEDRIWRAGENQVSMLHTEGALMIGDQKVPAGKYSVYVHAPADGAWSLVLNTNQGVPLGEMWAEAPDNMKKEPWPMLGGYDKSTEVARIKMDKASASGAEMFTMDAKDGKLVLHWGDQAWSTSVKAAK